MTDDRTIKVPIDAPFQFCDSCSMVEVEVDRIRAWEDGLPISATLYCTNANVCRNAIKLFMADNTERREE